MRVETMVKFHDLKANKIRESGELFIVDQERFKTLESLKLVTQIEEKPSQTKEKPKKPKEKG